MADSKTFVARFDLLDNFTQRFDALHKKIVGATSSQYQIEVGTNESSLREQAAGISKAVENVKNVTKSNADVQKEAGKAVEQHTAATQKAGAAINDLKSKYEAITGSIGKMKTALAGLTGMAAGGSVAGFAWKAAEESSLYANSVYDMLGRRGKVDSDAIKAFVAKATDSGYTSSTDRLSLTNLMVQRGAKNTDQAIGATEALEKAFFKDQVMLEKDYGITSAKGLGEFATQKYIRGQQAKQDLDNLFGKGFSSKSQSARIKALQKIGVDIDINAAMAEQPLAVIQTRIKSVTKSIGGELRGVMSPIADMFATILGIIDRNPILPKILAISAVLTVVIGSLVTIIGLLPVLSSGIGLVQAGLRMLTAGSGLASFASLLMNPYAILIALAAIILVVAYKTGVLTDAWDKFTKSAIGGDIISALGAVADVVGTVVDKFSAWYEASGRSQLLSYFMTLASVLGYAYDFIDQIYSKTKGATGNPLLAGIAALASMPIAIFAGGIKEGTGVDVIEVLGGMQDRLTQIYRTISSTIASVMEKVASILGRLLSVFEMIVNPIIKLFDMIRDIFGKFFGGEETTPLSNPEREDMVSWAKNLRKAGGSKMFDFGLNTDIWDIALKEAETGIAQDVPNMQDGGAEYRRLVNSYRNRIANPSEGLGDVAPEEGAAGNPFYNPAFTNKIDNPLGPDIRTAPADEIHNSAGVEGPFQTYGRAAWDWVSGWVSGGETKEAATGGDIRNDGLIKLHKDETVIPADIARSSYLVNLLRDASGGHSSRAPEIHIHNENKFDLSGAKLDQSFDVNKLLKEIDNMIERGSVKAVQNALGQRRT